MQKTNSEHIQWVAKYYLPTSHNHLGAYTQSKTGNLKHKNEYNQEKLKKKKVRCQTPQKTNEKTFLNSTLNVLQVYGMLFHPKTNKKRKQDIKEINLKS